MAHRPKLVDLEPYRVDFSEVHLIKPLGHGFSKVGLAEPCSENRP